MQRQFICSLLIFSTVLFVRSIGSPTAIDDIIGVPLLCPLVRCIDQCPNGFVINKRGCRTCECNPCRFGQPLYQSPCGGGQDECSKNNGLCKVSTGDNAYCCPNEQPGCCPPSPTLQVFLCVTPKCKNDYDCSVGQKCCRPCFQCVNATAY